MKKIIFTLAVLSVFVIGASAQSALTPKSGNERLPKGFVACNPTAEELDAADEQYDAIYQELNGTSSTGVTINLLPQDCTAWQFNGNFYYDSTGQLFERWDRFCYSGPSGPDGYSDHIYVMVY